ncbi:MAG TPA: radical SAM protein [Desulfatiglandales bacterium]|nr:radical SAM protein [Desulfatiglandales bacterium]
MMTTMPFILKELCLEVTNSCPMECRHCSSCSVKVGKETCYQMPISTAKNVVQEFTELGGAILEISGGEPLTYPFLYELCDYAVSLNLDIRLYTSGILSADQRAFSSITLSEAELLKEHGVNKVIFNLQGATPETHQKIVGVSGTHSLTTEGIKNTKAVGIWTGVHFVPMKPNFLELPELAKLCLTLGIDEFALLRFVPQGRGKENRDWLELTSNQFEDLLHSVLQLMEKHPKLNIRTGCPMDFLSLYDPGIKPHQCKAGLCTCTIAPTGEVLPCPGFKNASDFIAGNIYQKSLAFIWQNGFQSLREFNYKNITGPCQVCRDLNKCFGRCAAQRHIARGDIYKGPDPACPKKEEISFVDLGLSALRFK